MKPLPPHNKKAARILRKIRRLRILRRRDLYLRNIRRRPRPTQEVPEVISISADEEHRTEDRATSNCSLLNSTLSENEAPEVTANPPEAVPAPGLHRTGRLTQEQLLAMFKESSSSSDDEDDVPVLTPASTTTGDLRPASTAWRSQYHPSTPLQARMQESTEEEEAIPSDIEDRVRVACRILEATPTEVDEPEAGPSRPARESSPVRYLGYNNHLTNIHGRVPIMSPRVLVQCPPFPPCSPSCPCPPRSPPGAVYIHPCPPTYAPSSISISTPSCS